MSRRKRKRISITFIILLIIISGITAFNIYLDKVILKNIIPPMEEYLDKKIEVAGINLGPYGIKIYGVKIKDKSNKEIFACDKIYVYFLLKPLLDKEIIIDQIRMVKPRTSIYHQPDGKWVSPVFIEKPQTSNGKKIKIELKRVVLENGEIEITDDRVTPKVNAVLKKVKGYFELGKKINYEINAFIEDSKSEINLLGSVEPVNDIYKVHFTGKELDAVRFNPYYRIYFNYPVETGIVTNISLTLTGDKKTYRNKGDINFKDLNFLYFEGQKPVHAITGKVVFTSGPNLVLLENISGILDECSSFKVSGKVWPAIEGRDRYELLLDMEDMDFYMGKQRYIHQEGLRRDLDIKGRGNLVFRLLVDGNNIQYIGDADLKKVELDWGKVLYKPKDKACNLNFNINYNKNEKVLVDVKVVSSPMVIEGKGQITDLSKEPRLDLNLSLKEGNVEELLALLPPWPKDIKLFGTTDKLDVRIFNEEPQKTIYSIHINGTPLRWQYAKLFDKPAGMESKIDFDLVPVKDKILLVNPRLTFGDSEVKSSMIEIDSKGENGLKMDLDFSKLVFDDARKISNFFKEEGIKFNDFCSTRFTLNSTKEELSLDGEADVFSTKLGYNIFLNKEKDISGNLRFKLAWKGNKFLIKELLLESGKNIFLLNGDIMDYDKAEPQYNLVVFSDSFNWGELTPAYMPGMDDYKLSGRSNLKLSITGQKNFINLKGDIGLTKSETHWKEFLTKPKNINHKINFDFLLGHNNFIINKINISMGDFEVSAEGKLENYNTDSKKLSLVWKTENFIGNKLVSFIPSFSWLKNIEVKGLLVGENSIYKIGNLQKIKGKFNLSNIEVLYNKRPYKAGGTSDNIMWTINTGEDAVYIDSMQYTIAQSIFNVNGKLETKEDNFAVKLDINCDKLFLKEIISHFSEKMAAELEGLNIKGTNKLNLKLESEGKNSSWHGGIDLKDNYFSYNEIIAKPEGMDSKVVFKIDMLEDSINFDTLKFIWNYSNINFYGKIDKIASEPVLDLTLAGDMSYPDLKMIVTDSPEGQDVIKKFFSLRDKDDRIKLNLKLTGKIENPEIKSDWGLITAVAVKIGLQNSMDFLEKAAGKTLETTLNFGRKTVETTVLMGGKVLRETVRAGINVIEGVYKIIWPFKKK